MSADVPAPSLDDIMRPCTAGEFEHSFRGWVVAYSDGRTGAAFATASKACYASACVPGLPLAREVLEMEPWLFLAKLWRMSTYAPCMRHVTQADVQIAVLKLAEARTYGILSRVRVLRLGNPRAVGVALSEVAALCAGSSLRHLDLSGQPVSSADMTTIARRSRWLRRVNLTRSNMESLEWVAYTPMIEMLLCSECKIGSLLPLAQTAGMLETLVLIESPLASLDGLQHCPRLRALNIKSTQVSDIGPLHGLPQLETLNLEMLTLDGDNLAPLAGCRALRELSLVGSFVKDLTALHGLVNLKELRAGTLKAAAVHALTGALPTIRVIREW